MKHKKKASKDEEVKLFPPVMYGLKGIMSLFKVSKSTAWRYRHTIVKDACTQNGNKIMINPRKALQLFGYENPDELISVNAKY